MTEDEAKAFQDALEQANERAFVRSELEQLRAGMDRILEEIKSIGSEIRGDAKDRGLRERMREVESRLNAIDKRARTISKTLLAALTGLLGLAVEVIRKRIMG